MTNKVYVIENGLSVQGDVTFSGALIGDGSGLSGAGVSSWNDLTDKPTLFSGAYSDLTGKPSIPIVPTALSSFINDSGFIAGYTETDPIYTGSSWYSTINNSSNWDTAYNWGNHALAGYLTTVGWNNITSKPTFATVATSGSYDDLTNKPSIPSLTGYATELYVSNQIGTLINGAPTALDTLNELAAALGNDANYASSITNALSLKANTSSLATVATTGSYTDLINKPAGGVTISDSAPAPASNEQLWWDSSVGRLYIYYNDGNSSQWVDTSPSLVGPAGADGADGTTYTISSNVQLGSLGIGTSASGISGEIRAANNITAYYSSDFRLKENIKPIENALSKLDQIRGVTFDWTEEEIQRRGGVDDYFVRKSDIGVIAQEIEAVIPEAVATRPDGYKAVRYELIIPLLIESLKSQQEQINSLKKAIRGN